VEQIKAMEATLLRHFGKSEAKLDRAMRVFNLMLEGNGNREIAKEMGITNTMANKWVAKVRLILDSHRLSLV
jgi:DNA-binding NarL/FixJ family response regulator